MNYLLTLKIAFLVLLAGGCLHAGQEREEPVEKLKSTVDAALDVVYGDCCRDLSRDEKQAKVRELIENGYDLTVIVRRAMGRNWNLLDESEQATTMDLIKQLIVKTYFNGVEGKSRPEVSFGETIEVTDKRIEVPSSVKMNGQTYTVVYRLGYLQSGWQIYDIVAEDISVVSNYRQQFDDHFRRGDGAELIGKLQKLLAKDKFDEEIKL